jgi:hypothetical protein
MRQIGDKAYCIQHEAKLAVGHTETFVGGIQSLEKQVFTLKVGTSAEVHKCSLARIGIANLSKIITCLNLQAQ